MSFWKVGSGILDDEIEEMRRQMGGVRRDTIPVPAQSPTTYPPIKCVRCKQFADVDLNGRPYAEPNQPDGTYKCRACRENPYR